MQKHSIALQNDQSNLSENESDILLNDNATPEKILIVDDDPMNIHVLQAMLKLMNNDCNHALNGQDAIQKVKTRITDVEQNKTEMYRIIFLDYNMPDINGPEVAQEIRFLIEKASIPQPLIYCCSAYSHEYYYKQATQKGMNGFITKPVASKDLEQLLR